MEKAIKFKIPDEKNRRNALGDLSILDQSISSSFLIIEKNCNIIQAPSPGDWLWEYPNEGQTFKIYLSRLKMGEGNTISEKRNVIYIQPIDKSLKDDYLNCIQEYASAFFYPLRVKALGVDIQLSKKVEVGKEIQRRCEGTDNNIQLCAPDIMTQLEKCFPKDGLCIIGVTNQDLYIDEQNNFVFGLADPRARKGVISYCRYLKGCEDENLCIYRQCKVFCHEVSHLFGLRHCGYYRCIMEGSNHLLEDERKPVEPCVICLRKLHHCLQFDIKERYNKIKGVCEKFNGNFLENVKWIDTVLTQFNKFNEQQEKK